ncbi:hypothetical protein BDV25DRAFT_136797 [Aspergillus avenaceus]|uniref:Carrier domain-containing protein n=1 Tax=Aspergillus avenaceus TaxID=36643 RepID=A0A5N6U4I2_ASPAV|nr:hypothetical protein BDV25DRAFT_136797 [Aspergillus avenaceus]
MIDSEVPNSDTTPCPCFFPRLKEGNYATEKTPRVGVQEVKCSDVSVEDQDEESFSQLVHIAWSILLSEYIDSPKVTFGALSREAGEFILQQWEGLVDSHLPISQSVTLCNTCQWSIDNIRHREVFNTCIYIAQDDSLSFDLSPDFAHLQISDILLKAEQSSQRRRLQLYYSTLILDTVDARNISTTLEAVLSCLINSRDSLLSHSNLLSNHHWEQIAKWNENGTKGPLECCIHELFRVQCILHPGTQAICAWDGTMTYSELDQISSTVQILLASYRIEPESVIPLLFEKSKWVVAAILGVLKAGAAFLLLDPSYPNKRLQDICQDVKAKVIVCSNSHSHTKLTKDALVIGDNILEQRLSPSFTPPVVQPNHTAYIVYTSGSTGTPKGIIIEHRSFCTNAIASSRPQNINESSRVLQFASYAFDVSVFECLTPLLVGGCVCIPSETQRVNNLKGAVEELQVNWAELTPSVARLWQPEDVPSLTTLVLGGETMAPTDITQWKEKVQLICAYGPAECTVVSTVQPRVVEPSNIGSPPVGTCWIVRKLDHDYLVPIGAIGELVIGGSIVGRGYLNRPTLTQDAFIANPAWASRFQLSDIYRFYKTGDLARYSADGTIVYLSRKDTQIKLNGQRIELEEVEHQARPYFGNATIAAEVSAPMQRRPALILFYAATQAFPEDVGFGTILSAPTDPFTSSVRAANAGLPNILPRHMIPTMYVELTVMPMSRTGKIDRKILRQVIEQTSDEELKIYRATNSWCMNGNAETLIEKQLRQLFSDTLAVSIQNVQTSDNFLQLGGDSIGAIRLIRNAREMGLQMTVESLFICQSISKLAKQVQHMPEGSDQPTPPFCLLRSEDKTSSISCAAIQCNVRPEQVQDMYPCTPLQEALMAYSEKRPGAFVAQFSFSLPQTVDMTRFKHAWDTVIDAHPILRTRVSHIDGKAFQVVIHGGQPNPWDITYNLRQVNEPIISYGSALIHLSIIGDPYNLAPLTFILTMHHAAFDGWSYLLLLEAVEIAYRDGAVKPQPFAPFIKHVSSLDLDLAKEFWCAEFKGSQHTLFPSISSEHWRTPELITTVNRQIMVSKWPEGNYTPSTIIHLAVAMLIAWSTACNDVVFGLTVAGRNAPVLGVDRMTGPTIATFPLRTVLDDTMSIQMSLENIQDHLTRIIPFEQTGLRRIKSFGVDAARACDFQTLLIIQPAASDRSFGILLESPSNSNEQLKFSTCPLTLVCELAAKKILAKAVFDTSILSPDTVESMLQRLDHIIGRIAHSPEASIHTVIPVSLERHDDNDKVKQPWKMQVEQQAYEFLRHEGECFVIVESIVPNGALHDIIVLFVSEEAQLACSHTSSRQLFINPDECFRQKLSSLMGHLRTSLPSSSVPSLCLPISYLPATPSGSLDIPGLCEAASCLNMQELRSLLNPVDKFMDRWQSSEQLRLRSIIAHALRMNVHDVGPDDDFFTIGGDSVTAMQVVSLCRKHHLSLTASDIFDRKTVKSIAECLKPLTTVVPQSIRDDPTVGTTFKLLSFESDQKRRAFASMAMAACKVESMEDVEDAYPCTQVHRGLLTTQMLRPFDYQSYTIWEVLPSANDSHVCPVRLRDAWVTVSNYHPALRTVLMTNGMNSHEHSNIHIVRKSHTREIRLITCSKLDVYSKLRPPAIRLGCDPLYPHAFTICHTPSGKVFCKLEGSHAFLDAASVLVILQDLARAYEGILPKQGPAYSTAVDWLRSLPDIEIEMDYWKQQIKDATPCIFPPLRDPVPDETLFIKAFVSDAAVITQFCTKYGLTISNVLQVAWGLLLREYTKSDNVCFGTLVAGRDALIPDIDKMVGSFFNVLVCQLDFGRENTLSKVLCTNQQETGNRLLNQHCALIDVLRFNESYGRRLFNTCMSVEHPLSMDMPGDSISFKELETREPTEYDLIASITIGTERIDLGLTYKSCLLTDEQACAVTESFKESIFKIISS